MEIEADLLPAVEPERKDCTKHLLCTKLHKPWQLKYSEQKTKPREIICLPKITQ